MNITSFLVFVIALLTVIIPGAVFVAKANVRTRRLRNIFERVCLQLSPDQREAPADDRFKEVRHLLRPEVDALTAIEFIDLAAIGVGGNAERRRCLLDDVGAIFPSMFILPIVRLISLASVTALLTVPFFLAVASLVEPLPGILGAVVKMPSGVGVAIVIGLAAAGGILLSLVITMIIWRVFHVRDVEDVKFRVGDLPIWSPGPTPKPGGRKLGLAKDDPTYLQLGN